jgi:hypothetical protein
VSYQHRVMLDEHEEPEVGGTEPEPPPIVKVGAVVFWLLRWLGALSVAVLIMIVGELLAPLRRIDSALAPYHRTLGLVLGTLVAIGFVAFMGGIFALMLYGKPGDGEVSLREDLWQKTPRMRRFRVIAGGVVLMLFAGAALGVVFTPPGIKLLLLVAVGYTVARYLLARIRIAASM